MSILNPGTPPLSEGAHAGSATGCFCLGPDAGHRHSEGRLSGSLTVTPAHIVQAMQLVEVPRHSSCLQSILLGLLTGYVIQAQVGIIEE